ncbi:ABC transporter permease subunit [Vagococcus elongatus]|uniref:ABC transporter permease n=1 Tax=Vagococcus elongatus TaxID=180344 RepID=A0A430AHR4_9ENTE|nr:ABC transporter permease subunit [Vagococcus elongatus]RSU07611.1 hypothetical protein CBF29_13450 [Vagococcus elongatus]
MIVSKIEWRLNKKSLFIWMTVMGLLIVLFMAMFPSMQSKGIKELLDSQLDSLPQNMLVAFNLDSKLRLTNPIGYFSYVMQYLFIGSCIYSAMLGSACLIKEESEGTIEFLLSQPVSRSSIALQKFLTNFVILLIFWLVLAAASLGSIILFDTTEMDFGEIFKDVGLVFSKEFLILLFFLSMGFLLSTLIKSSSQSVSLSLGLVLLLYLLGILGDLQEKLSFLKAISPVNQGIPNNILGGNDSNAFWLILSAGVFLCIGGALIIYQQKDLKV